MEVKEFDMDTVMFYAYFPMDIETIFILVFWLYGKCLWIQMWIWKFLAINYV